MDVPRIDLLAAPAGSRELVLLAHGGQENSVAESPNWRAPLLRMWPFARAAAQAAPGAAVALLRYRYRGWNGPAADAAADLRTVLDQADYDRVLLIGHSMGGRAVLWHADHDKVHAVLALAPWLPESDPLVDTGDRVVVLAHGDQDRVTYPALTWRYAAKLRAAGANVACFSVTGETHAMLRRYGDWDELVRRFTRHTLADADAHTDDPAPLAAALDSNPSRPVDPMRRWTRSHGRIRAVASIITARLRLPVLRTP